MRTMSITALLACLLGLGLAAGALVGCGDGAPEMAGEPTVQAPAPEPDAISASVLADPAAACPGQAKGSCEGCPSKGKCKGESADVLAKGACKSDCADCPSKGECKGESTDVPAQGACKGDCADCPSKSDCKGSCTDCPSKSECKGDCTDCPSKGECKGDCTKCASKKATMTKTACLCAQGKAGEPVWCDACNKGYVDGKPAGCKGCVAEALKAAGPAK